MAITVSLNGLNGDWIMNNQTGNNRVWTKGIYSIVYSSNMFTSGNSGWIIKMDNEGTEIEIFGIVSSTDPWINNPTIVWNPNITGYDDDTTANMVLSVIEEANPIDINPAYYRCNSVSGTTWTGYKMSWDKDNGWVASQTLTSNLSVSGFTPQVNTVYNVNTTSLIYLHPDMPSSSVIATTASASDIRNGKTAVLNGTLTTGTMSTSSATKSGNTVSITEGYKSAETITVGTAKGAQTYTPGTADQIIAADMYTTGAQVIKGDSNLLSENIKKGVTIFGIVGTYEATSSGGDDVVATAEDLVVSDCGLELFNGVYKIQTSGSTGTSRVWVHTSGTSTISWNGELNAWHLCETPNSNNTENDFLCFASDPTGTWQRYTVINSYNPPTVKFGGSSGGNDSSSSGESASGANLIVAGVSSTMAASMTPAFVYADGTYTLVDASASGNARMWHLSNGGYDFYFQWSATEGAWVLSESSTDPAANGFPYIYATSATDNPWDATSWEFNMTGSVDISVTQGADDSSGSGDTLTKFSVKCTCTSGVDTHGWEIDLNNTVFYPGSNYGEVYEYVTGNGGPDDTKGMVLTKNMAGVWYFYARAYSEEKLVAPDASTELTDSTAVWRSTSYPYVDYQITITEV